MIKDNYKLYVPSGNPTALVLRMERNSEKRKEINNEIMNKYDFIEQVGFINMDIKKPELLMAGGEFCGNATIVRLYRGFIVVCSKANCDYPLFFSVGLLINSKQFKTTK